MSARKRRRDQADRSVPAARAAPAIRARTFMDPVIRWSRRHHRLALVAVLGLYALLAALSFEPQPHTGGDNAGYITLAHSLLQRHAYLDLYDPAEPPHTKYPPVFPVLLAAGMLAGLKPWIGLKLIVLALGGGAIAGTFLWIRRRGRPGLALAVGMLLALSPGALREVHWILSDVPFWCFTAVALWAFERLSARDWRRFALALAATTLAYFTRSAGLPLVVAAVAWLAWRRRWRQLAVFLVVLGPLAFLWWLRARTLSGGVAYAGEFWLVNPYQPELGRVAVAGLIARLGQNLANYGTIHLPVLLRGLPVASGTAASLLVAALALYGWARRLRRARVAEFFLPLYLGLILLWPAVWSGERFLLPVLGLLLCYAGEGVTRALGRVRSARALYAGAAGTALLVLVALPGLAENVRWGTACMSATRQGIRYPCIDRPWQEYFAMAEWAGASLPHDAVVLTRKPRLFYVLSGLKSRNYPMASTTQALLAAADSAHARWIVYDQLGSLSERYLVPALLQRPGAFCIAQSAGASGVALFGILPNAASIADAPAVAGAEVSFTPCDAGAPQSSLGPPRRQAPYLPAAVRERPHSNLGIAAARVRRGVQQRSRTQVKWATHPV